MSNFVHTAGLPKTARAPRNLGVQGKVVMVLAVLTIVLVQLLMQISSYQSYDAKDVRQDAQQVLLLELQKQHLQHQQQQQEQQKEMETRVLQQCGSLKSLLQQFQTDAQSQLSRLTESVARKAETPPPPPPVPVPEVVVVAKDEKQEEKKEEQRYPGTAIVGIFNHKEDTHQLHVQRQAKTKFINPWYKSVSQHTDVQGVILNSMYGEQFVKERTTDAISFVQVDLEGPVFQKCANQSLNNQRFFFIEDYLDKRIEAESKGDKKHDEHMDYILLTDVQDVMIYRNPFRYMIEMDKLTEGKHHLFVGSEFEPNKLGLGWQRDTTMKCLGKPFDFHLFVNAGIIGGHRSIVIPLVKEMNRRMLQSNHTVCDQAVLQQITMEWYQEKIITGYPLHSRFNAEQTSKEDTLAYIRHK